VALVIFDCDGVLVDSERLAVRVEAQLLATLGWPIGEHEILERFVGRSDAHMLQASRPPSVERCRSGRRSTGGR
jgi:beta-phosphoglucomutase-like phosphatase (HAD superfamily)